MTATPARRPIEPSAFDILRDQIAPSATDGELAYLIEVANRYELDPVAGQIVLIPRWDGRLQRNVSRPQITAEGRLVLADRTGELVGIVGPEWTGPRRDDGTHQWFEVWDEDEPPHAARVFVQRRGWESPVNGTVRWQEFAQYDRFNKLLPTWAKMPSHMLGKTAMSLGLRRAFPGIVPVDLEAADITFRGTAGAAVEVAPPTADAATAGDIDGSGEAASVPTSDEPPDSRLSGDEFTGTEAPPPDDEPGYGEVPPKRLTDDQQAEIAALMHALGKVERDEQLAYAGAQLGRTVDPESGRISYDEGEQLIAALKRDRAS